MQQRATARFLIFLLFVFALIGGQAQTAQARVGEPVLLLTKTIEGGATTAKVGDTIRYRIRFECSSLTTSCGVMQIQDVLQAGLTYLPPPNSSVPAGFLITEAPAGTITITKVDNNLLDGSQFDVVIAVKVNYGLRDLPATINNTITGNIDPPGPVGLQIATPSSAPQITIDTVTPSWSLAKTLYSPSINPTIDTDVTYKIALCPTTVSGNVALSNIVMIDSLPTGATYISASDSGVPSGVPVDTVTWNIAGPVIPPTCIDRYVTIRYNTADGFIVGNTVVNTANANGQYVKSVGGLCVLDCVGITTAPITHPIIVIKEVPNYGKVDTGDPVGINGTARFILNLDTKATNYPSKDLMLIDNLPPELQVTQIAGGAWEKTIPNSSGGTSPEFEHVRAIIEYSTDNGLTYPFILETALYNTNLVYNAPVTNITNVRWRFEYDPDGVAPFTYTQPGLPFSWEFSTLPEVRVTPRTVATTATDIANTPMPAAVIGTTYDNCVQVSRTNSLLAPVTEPCVIEDMTVRSDFVSLRVSKAETPGLGWDDLYDPTISTFTADNSLLPGDTLKYTITVDMTERSSNALINPTILDTLPADLVFVRNGTALLDGGAVQQPTFTQTGQDLKWQWTALTVPLQTLGNHSLTVEFFAYIPRGQSPGTLTNNIYVVTDSIDVVCEIGSEVADTANVDGDVSTAKPACTNTDTYVVERAAALRGEKWIRSTDATNSQVVDMTTFLPDGTCPVGGTAGITGGGSNPFTRFPCISQAYPEGALSPNQIVPPPTNPALDDFEYNLRIFNDGNVSMVKYVLYDILPYVGDNGSGGTLASSPRLSAFQPTLRGPIEFISGTGVVAGDFTIEYNLTNNPCRPEVFNLVTGTISPGGCNDTWTTVWSTAVRSYRIRLNAGKTIPNSIPANGEPRFGVPMYIPAGVAQSKQIAWNSFSHVGSYTALDLSIRDLLASEPRKVGISIPERMSVGNRVWRDSDNSGTINAPDDVNPGIANVTVNLYRASDTTTVIATTTTDSGGYYLFSNIPYDAVVAANNNYVIGIPASNFATATDPLNTLRSSTGTPSSALYTNPPSTNGDSTDNGIDPASPGLEVFSASFELQPTTEPASESNLSANNRDGRSGMRRGVNGEKDTNSDLTIDFGFFGGTDVPFSIGNHVWYDNGEGVGGVINDGILQASELPVQGLLIRLYRDGNNNGTAEPLELIRTDTTDVGGFYLFDNLDPGRYLVEIPASEFAVGKPLEGRFSSQPVMATNVDKNDNGINSATPETTGIFSGVVVLARGVSAPLNETVSGDTSSEAGFSPTAGDGPLSLGRFGETDATSNLTVDFGFIPPMSLGNRLWFDDGTGGGVYNNGIMEGTELPVVGASVQLWRDTNGTPGLQIASDTLLDSTTTDVNGYYLFNRLQPGTDYYVHIPKANFSGANPLTSYYSSFDTTPPADNSTDKNDNGIDSATPPTTGITSQNITMAYNTEPQTPADETDIPADVVTYGAGGRGLFGQGDADSNLTIDFGFIPVFSLGNRVWFDTNNNSLIDSGEVGVNNVRVQLFASDGTTPIPVGADGILGTADDDNNGMLTSGGGYYLFNNLAAGSYVVSIPASNFTTGVLKNYWSSATSRDNTGALTEIIADLANSDTDLNDNGTLQPSGAVISSLVTLGPTITSEPASEADKDTTLPGNQQGQPDLQANMTVDFGFYTITLGNQVWNDSGAGVNTNNGLLDVGELGINGVDVQLWSADGLTLLATVTTATVGPDDGIYTFTGLPKGDYIIRIPATEFQGADTLRNYASSTGGALNPYEPAPDTDVNITNLDDNGSEVGSLGFAGGYIQTSVITLTPAGEDTVNNASGLTSEPRVDFGVYTNAKVDLSVTKTDGQAFYLAGGTLTYTIVVTNNGPADVVGALFADLIPAQVATWTWTCAPAATGGATGCDSAASNSVNFTDTVDLPYNSTITYTVVAIIKAGATLDLTNTATISLPTGSLIGETNLLNNTVKDVDTHAALTVSKTDALTVVAPNSTMTYTITVLNSGDTDLTSISVVDTLPADLTYVSSSPAATVAGQVVTWTGISLLKGATLAPALTVTVQVNAAPVGTSVINSVQGTDSVTNATSTATDTDNIATSNVKTLTATSEIDSGAVPPANPEPVFIGETLTYTISLNIPPGTLTNLVADDVLEAGLAFDECTATGVVVSAATVTTTLVGGFPAACPTAAGDARVTNTGHNIQFTFGDVTNASLINQTITVEYQVIVLDIPSNVSGVTGINNAATWSWTGGSLSGLATPVNIIEPDLSIIKRAAPTVAEIGSAITFTLDIAHTAQSTADAYDVIVTDILPPGLGYVAGSAVFSGGNVPPTSITSLGSTTLTIIWNYFPLQVAGLPATATITFQAVFLGPSPVTNEASVAWTSLPIDPGLGGLPVQQSNYNVNSTERWYDPANPASVNNYRVSSNISISTPLPIEVDKLPKTGFAPAVFTQLPLMPEGFKYKQTELALEIPALKVKMNIVGVPFTEKEKQWNVTWLNSDGGWLEHTAFPTYNGNSAITAHSYLSNGLPGPFVKLSTLKYGELIIVHLGGQKFIYEVQENKRVRPSAVNSVLKHEEISWLTLLTCETYSESAKDYLYRIVVRAVLVKVE